MFETKIGWLMVGVVLAVLAMPCACAQSQYIPESFAFSENYYTAYGGPEINAVLVGSNEYERGEDTQVQIDLYNFGKVLGLKSEKTPTTATEIAQAESEKNYEGQITTAIGVVASLKNPYGAPITLSSGPQSAGSLRAGSKTLMPLTFSMKIDDDAPAGEYTLVVESTFSYQKNAQVGADTGEVSLWYENMTQSANITLSVKRAPRFEVVNVSAKLHPGDKTTLTVLYRNVGEVPAGDATARISLVDPFSSTDDQAFLGTLQPNESAEATFKLNVDSAALPKRYGLNSELKYTDTHGDSKLSDVLKVEVDVEPKTGAFALPLSSGVLTIVGLLVVLGLRRRR